MKNKNLFLIVIVGVISIHIAHAQSELPSENSALNQMIPDQKNTEDETDVVGAFESTLFDDRALIEGYTKRYSDLSLDIIQEMIKDETLSPYQMTAAIRVLNTNHIPGIV